MHALLPVASLYTALAALFYIGLSVAVIRLRWRFLVPILDGGHEPLTRAIRTHANFAEYVPFSLFMLALLELSGRIPFWGLHVLGAWMLIGRCFHVYSTRVFELKHHTYYLRATSMFCTFGVLSVSALLLLYVALA